MKRLKTIQVTRKEIQEATRPNKKKKKKKYTRKNKHQTWKKTKDA